MGANQFLTQKQPTMADLQEGGGSGAASVIEVRCFTGHGGRSVVELANGGKAAQGVANVGKTREDKLAGGRGGRREEKRLTTEGRSRLCRNHQWNREEEEEIARLCRNGKIGNSQLGFN